MAQSSIPVKDSEGKVVGNQKFVAGDNVNFEFYEEGKKEPVILIDSKSGGLVIDNSNHEYDAISTEEFIEIPVKDVTIDSKNNVTFTANVADDARTFTIGPNYVSQKDGKEEKVITSTEAPFQVALPNNLPELISENKVEVKKLPVNIFDTLKDVGYESFELSDKNLMLLKAPNGQLMSVVGNYIQPCGEVNYYNSADSSILAIGAVTKSGAVAGKATSAYGYKLTEEELAEVGKFVEGRDLTSKDYKKIKGKDMPVDFVEPKRIGKGVTKDLHQEEVTNGKPEGVADSKEAPKIEEPSDEKDISKDVSPAPGAVADTTPVEDDKKDGDENPAGGQPNGVTSLEEAPKDGTTDKDAESKDKPVDGDKDNKKDDDKKVVKKSATNSNQAEVKKDADDKRRKAIAKGIQVVALLLFASVFVPALLGAAIPFAMGMALPLLAILAVGLISPELTNLLEKTIVGFEKLFIGKDSFLNKAIEAVQAKNNVKDLTTREQDKLNKLQEKLEKGTTKKQQKKYNKAQKKLDKTIKKFTGKDLTDKQKNKLDKLRDKADRLKNANPLSEKKQAEYTRLSQRQTYNLSNNEWKSQMKGSISYQPFVNIQRLVQDQETKFTNDKQAVLNPLNRKIENCEKLLSGKEKLNGRDLTDLEKVQLGRYRNEMIAYRDSIDDIKNPARENNNAILKDYADNVRDNDWATKTEKDLNQTTFEETLKTEENNGSIEQKEPTINNDDLGRKLDDMFNDKKDNDKEITMEDQA